uniref:transcriptional regulator ATRX-like isoform X1 n=2 Tax=Vespula vulgaris TaxID=7454 RepID=UPI0021403B6B|nr:transcriptional regulator ATRX-like isoform X1 [Vespula vulgaris]
MVKQLIIKVSSRELAYRTEHYHDIKIIKERPITCTSCGNKVIIEARKIFTHPVIGTLLCEKCWDHFNNIDFSSDKDHADQYCRLCAHEKNLYTCGSSNCIFAFCKQCIKRNAPLSLLDIEKNNWKCFICEPKPLWELRAVCASIMDRLNKRNKKKTVLNEFKHDSVLPYKRYQQIQIKKMQKALQSICDDQEDSDENPTQNKSLCQKSVKKEESNVTTKKSTTSKNRSLNKLFSTTSSNNSSDNEAPKKESSLKNLQKSCKIKVSNKDDSTSDTKLEVQHKTFKTSRNQQQKKVHLENTHNLSLDDVIKMKPLKVSKKSKDKSIISSCSSISDNEQSESLTRIRRRHSVASHDNKIENINSDSESDEKNMESNRKKCKMLFNRSNKKKCYTKQSADEQDKKNVHSLTSQSPIEIDTNSSSGGEFQRIKLVRTNYDSLRKKQNKKIHMSSKKNIINKHQYEYLKSNITEILDELKQQCSVFELQAQHIENKCKRKPMYMENANKIIYKSKSAINKLIMEFSSYEKHLMNFYKTFVSSIKEEKEEEHESSDDDTISMKKEPQKRKSSDTIRKDNSKYGFLSDCDSEIFSGNEAINPETAETENIIYKKEISVSEKVDQCSSSSKSVMSKSVVDDIEESKNNPIVLPEYCREESMENLNKLSGNAVVRCNINNETCIKNDDRQNELTGNCTDGDITKCDSSKKEFQITKNKDNKDEISSDISNKRTTTISSNVKSTVTNDSLNDIFEISSELDNENRKSNTIKNIKNKDTHDIDTKDIQKESNDNCNTECNKSKDVLLSNEKEFDSLREETQDNISKCQEKTQKIYESNKSNSDSEKSEQPSQKSEVNPSCKKRITVLVKQIFSELDSDTSNISDIFVDSTEVSDKSKDPLYSINENELQVNKEKQHNSNENDCSAITSPNLDRSEPIMELTLDNVKQQNSKNHTLTRSSSEETNFLDAESNDKMEECIKNALLESDSDDSIASPFNKEIGINTECHDTDFCKKMSTTFDSESTKSDELNKSQMQINNNKSQKKYGAQKRNYDLESDSSVGSRVKRRRLQLHKNHYYMNDKKLRMICHVQIEILQDHVLDQYKDALQKSKEHQNNKKIKRLINLDTLEKSYKKKSSVMSKEDNKLSKSLQSLKKSLIKEEEEDSLMDHLKKIQDGSISVNAEDDSDNDEQNLNSTIESHSAILTNNDLMLEADRIAKDLLLNSSDSNLDCDKEEQSIISDKEEELSNEKDKSNKQNEIKQEVLKTDNEELSADEKQKKLKKRRSKWRRNKILTMKISDSESEKEQEKWMKTQDKLKTKEEDSDKDNINIKKKITEYKRKKNRRILDSDSDIKEINTDTESSLSSSSSSSDLMLLSTSDDTSEEKKKKKKKQNAKKSSDTESSVAGTKQKPKRRRIKNVSSDSNSDNDKMNNSQGTSSKSGRKNIRKVLKDKQVAEDTKQAAKEEEERLKRIMERQKLYNEMYEIRLAGEEKVEKLVLDFDPNTKEELISVHKDLVKRLKPHQAKGIKFMWDACFESLERVKTTSGSGCIIAHCMGLGKTLQVITLSHTLLTHEETGVKTILVVCPLSTVLNWVNEFELWLKDVENGDIDTFELTKCKKNFERKYQLQHWHNNGGVLVIGYEMFRNLTGMNKNIRKHMKDAILKCLIDPGPDLIVCDEGHLLKNEDTALSKSMKQVKTLRRIVLTGTPLQNNLIEYHCMVQFVKPNLLGTKREFLNRFVNPITNGQFDNSTEYDVKLMKKRAHVLHKLLQGSIQRFDYSVLTPFLPPKQEYVIFVRLTDVQIKLYQYYLDNLSRHLSGIRGTLFPDFQALQRIWTHPLVLRLNSEKVEKTNEKKRYASDSEGSLRNFVVSDEEETTSSSSTNDSDVQSVHSSSPTQKRKTRSNACENDSESESLEIVTEKEEWWSQFVEPEHFDDMRISTKLVLLFAILKECEKIGDKVLVFSQSLYSLTLIEQFLSQIDEAEQRNVISEKLEGHTGSWSLGLDYFRLDGQTSAENRSAWCRIFNRTSNTRGRLFLISTRAGGLGINLTAANRVIIFDASWNPSHDIQSIFRVYRFGQKKPCYVYRFLASGTMEEKIYNRQVTKLSLSCRVVDEQQIERHYSHNALNELYKFEPHSDTDKPTLNLPKDRLLAEIFLKYKDLVENYHEHDSLLENKADEELDEEERKQAWLEYEEEKKGPPSNTGMTAYQNNILLQQYNNMIANLNRQNVAVNNSTQSNDYENLQKLIEKDYPNATPEQRKFMTARALVDMYNYWEQQAMVQPSRNPIVTQNIQQKVTPLGTTNVSTATNQNLLRQQLLQNQQMMYGTNNTYTNVSNPPLKNPVKVINTYSYPKASTSNIQSRNDVAQIAMESTNTAENSAKTSTVPTNKEQEE